MDQAETKKQALEDEESHSGVPTDVEAATEEQAQEAVPDVPKRGKKPPQKEATPQKKPKKNGQKAKASFARRYQPQKDPSHTAWLALKEAFEKVIASRITFPSSWEDPVSSERVLVVMKAVKGVHL